MPSASSNKRWPGLLARRVGLALALAGAVAVAVALTGGHSSRPAAPPVPRGEGYLASVTTTLGATGIRRVHAALWWGRVYTASTGDQVSISISDSYPADDAVGQAWADFFAGLVHGPELPLIHVYVVTPDEVAFTCGDPYALGCYGSNQLVIIGETAFGTDPKEVARHEYGHHVAANRFNPPWQAIDWGTKRWASYEGVCKRVASGSAFPGDEDLHYRQNPGEAFAETYRVLNDNKAGTTFPWSIVDASFIPDATALADVEQDVLQPWTAPTTKVVHGRFTEKSRKPWKLSLATQLDGLMDVTLSLPKGGLYSLTLLAGDGKTVLASGLWSGLTQKKLSYTICGQRSVIIRVTQIGAVGRFTVQYTEP
jgi:hypothetical protein